MGLFKKLKAPKGKIESKLDEVSYEATDRPTGKILLDPEEDISACARGDSEIGELS